MKLHIADMLRGQKKHLSFHTPGHKQSGGDITELDYSDNLSSPTGVILRAEEDIAKILGSERSFILTDGSTSGVYAMLFALSKSGAKTVACSPYSHPSVLRGCELAHLTPVLLTVTEEAGIPLQPTVAAVEEGLKRADALLLTSPDYYGNFPDLQNISALCRAQNKPLLIDGAHGSHLHGTPMHASAYADTWVDGVHKSLPALTQGAVVSAKKGWEERLMQAVAYFRTSSPSYPIMASVEYAVKYPRNERIEGLAQAFKEELGAYPNADWSKILIPFGTRCDGAQAYLQAHGVYPEFNDGNYLTFYLSPAIKPVHLKRLKGLLKRLPRQAVVSRTAERAEHGDGEEWLSVTEAEGRICARDCGLFPPCLPLILRGERVSAEKIKRLVGAKSTYGLEGGKIAVFLEKK